MEEGERTGKREEPEGRGGEERGKSGGGEGEERERKSEISSTWNCFLRNSACIYQEN